MSISYLEAVERDERNAADAARLLRDDEAEECAKIAEEAGAGIGHTIAQGIADRIRARITERAYFARKAQAGT